MLPYTCTMYALKIIVPQHLNIGEMQTYIQSVINRTPSWLGAAREVLVYIPPLFASSLLAGLTQAFHNVFPNIEYHWLVQKH